MLKAFILSHVICYLISIGVLVMLGVLYSASVIRNYQVDQIYREALLLDNALIKYSSFHIGVLQNSVDVNQDGQMHYRATDLYPVDLDALGAIRNEGNYFSDYIDLNLWQYQTRIESDGRMVYSLRRELPDGSIYTSPNSAY